jgi:hypothetical protein
LRRKDFLRDLGVLDGENALPDGRRLMADGALGRKIKPGGEFSD